MMIEEYVIIGDKKYKCVDVQNVLNDRLPSYPVEEEVLEE